MDIQPPAPFPTRYGYFVLVGDVRHDFKGKNARKDAFKFYNRQLFLMQPPPPEPPLTAEDLLRDLQSTLVSVQSNAQDPITVSDLAEEAMSKIKEYFEE